MPQERTRADIVELFSVTEVTVRHLSDEPAAVCADQMVVRTPQQGLVLSAAELPGDRIIDFEIESDSQVRIEMSLDVELGAVRVSEIELVVGNFFQ